MNCSVSANLQDDYTLPLERKTETGSLRKDGQFQYSAHLDPRPNSVYLIYKSQRQLITYIWKILPTSQKK